MDVINMAPQLACNLPQTERQQSIMAESFRSIVTSETMCGCVGCVDGLLTKVAVPSAKQTGPTAAPAKACCSGHHRTHRINIQGVCDQKLQFIHAEMGGLGSCDNVTAFKKTILPKFAESLPMGKHLIGDNAHPCSENH